MEEQIRKPMIDATKPHLRKVVKCRKIGDELPLVEDAFLPKRKFDLADKITKLKNLSSKHGN